MGMHPPPPTWHNRPTCVWLQVSLTRPQARNAIGRQFLRELVEALTNIAREQTTRCVLVKSGVDGVFCAGADLKVRQQTWNACAQCADQDSQCADQDSMQLSG
jgi:enoyl-CoA hydratase/carnithine racemase